jgi:holo-[acyl-carrier protein] synthase
MIRGLGIDLACISRVHRLYTLYGQRFLAKAFHPAEAAHACSLPAASVGPFLASRWAVKEALHKALGGPRLLFPDIQLHRSPAAAPALLLHNAAAVYQREQGLAFHVTLSHERDMAVACVLAYQQQAQQQ